MPTTTYFQFDLIQGDDEPDLRFFNPNFTAIDTKLHSLDTADAAMATSLAAKADSSALTTGLATKADATALTAGLAGKADSSALTSGLAAKADTTALTSGLAAKADSSALTSGLAGKADTSALISGLAAKADTTALTSGLAGKVGTSDSRLSDARTPTTHHVTHEPGGSDALDLTKMFPSTVLTGIQSGGALSDATALNGLVVYVTDVGGGQFYKADGGVWKPVGQKTLLDSIFPAALGAGSAGTNSSQAARADHSHPTTGLITTSGGTLTGGLQAKSLAITGDDLGYTPLDRTPVGSPSIENWVARTELGPEHVRFTSDPWAYRSKAGNECNLMGRVNPYLMQPANGGPISSVEWYINSTTMAAWDGRSIKPLATAVETQTTAPFALGGTDPSGFLLGYDTSSLPEKAYSVFTVVVNFADGKTRVQNVSPFIQNIPYDGVAKLSQDTSGGPVVDEMARGIYIFYGSGINIARTNYLILRAGQNGPVDWLGKVTLQGASSRVTFEGIHTFIGGLHMYGTGGNHRVEGNEYGTIKVTAPPWLTMGYAPARANLGAFMCHSYKSSNVNFSTYGATATDGVVPTTGFRILANAQTDTTQNGPWQFDGTNWTQLNLGTAQWSKVWVQFGSNALGLSYTNTSTDTTRSSWSAFGFDSKGIMLQGNGSSTFQAAGTILSNITVRKFEIYDVVEDGFWWSHTYNVRFEQGRVSRCGDWGAGYGLGMNHSDGGQTGGDCLKTYLVDLDIQGNVRIKADFGDIRDLHFAGINYIYDHSTQVYLLELSSASVPSDGGGQSGNIECYFDGPTYVWGGDYYNYTANGSGTRTIYHFENVLFFSPQSGTLRSDVPAPSHQGLQRRLQIPDMEGTVSRLVAPGARKWTATLDGTTTLYVPGGDLSSATDVGLTVTSTTTGAGFFSTGTTILSVQDTEHCTLSSAALVGNPTPLTTAAITIDRGLKCARPLSSAPGHVFMFLVSVSDPTVSVTAPDTERLRAGNNTYLLGDSNEMQSPPSFGRLLVYGYSFQTLDGSRGDLGSYYWTFSAQCKASVRCHSVYGMPDADLARTCIDDIEFSTAAAGASTITAPDAIAADSGRLTLRHAAAFNLDVANTWPDQPWGHATWVSGNSLYTPRGRGDWASWMTMDKLDVVRYNGAYWMYMRNEPRTGLTPTDTGNTGSSNWWALTTATGGTSAIGGYSLAAGIQSVTAYQPDNKFTKVGAQGTLSMGLPSGHSGAISCTIVLKPSWAKPAARKAFFPGLDPSTIPWFSDSDIPADNLWHAIKYVKAHAAGGASWVISSGVPSGSAGKDGDMAFQTTPPTLYGPKNVTWGTGTPITGPTGPAGHTILSGTAAPTQSDGSAGDIWIRNDTGTTPATLSLYGPKTSAGSGAWGSALPLRANLRGAWAASTAYLPFDVVTFHNKQWLATTSFTSSSTFSTSNWTQISGGVYPTGTWSSSTAYFVDDLAYRNGTQWRCIVANTNSAPAAGNTNWEVFAAQGNAGPSAAAAYFPANTVGIPPIARGFTPSTVTPAATGKPFAQAYWLNAGDVVAVLGLYTVSGWSTSTHWWFGVSDVSGNLQGYSADQTTTTASAQGRPELSLITPYTAPTAGIYYFIFNMAATTMPTFHGCNSTSQAMTTLTPVFAAQATQSGITDGASVSGALTLTTNSSVGIVCWMKSS